MPNTTVEEIVEEVKTLPPEQQEKLREAVDLAITLVLVGGGTKIMEKTLTLMPDELLRLRDALDAITLDFAGPEGKALMVRHVRGKYAHLPTGSESFAARKAEEIRLEDRRSRP
jgi:hypothetical protein